MNVRFLAALFALVLAWPALPAWADSTAGPVTGDANVQATISSDNQAVAAEGLSYALSDFKRAQAGSNREVDGSYQGYGYFLGADGYDLSLIATNDFAVLYIDAGKAAQFGIDLQSSTSAGDLVALVRAIDNANASGGAQIDESLPVYVTADTTYAQAGLVFRFNVQGEKGSYDFVATEAGTDPTESASGQAVRFTHGAFAQVVDANEANILAQPSRLDQLASFLSRIDYSPLWVTLKTTFTSIVFIFILGLAAAYFTLRISPRARDIFDAIFTIPMVLPPTVCGFLLLLALGNNTTLGRWFIDIGFPLIFSWPATVIAAVVVAFPLMYRSARGAFEALDPNMLDAARTLGWSNGRIFFKLMLPLAWSNIASGTVLAFARALGEFGATLFLAGNYLGITRTIPIAIYFEWMNGNTDVAIFWTVIILIFSFIVILFINLWGRRATRYKQGAVEE